MITIILAIVIGALLILIASLLGHISTLHDDVRTYQNILNKTLNIDNIGIAILKRKFQENKTELNGDESV